MQEFLESLEKIKEKAAIELPFGEEKVEIKTSNLISFVNFKKFEQEKKEVD